MPATTIRRTRSTLVIMAAAVISIVLSTGAASALPQQVGITTNDSETVIPVGLVVRPDRDDTACQTAACIVPAGTVTEDRLRRLHLSPAGPGQAGFVGVIDGQTVVVDRVVTINVSAHWRGMYRGVGFTEH